VTIENLILILKKYDKNLKVVVNGYEGGFDELKTAELISITHNENRDERWWLGEFKEVLFTKGDELGETAVLLPRR
jgi:hypothetical protein